MLARAAFSENCLESATLSVLAACSVADGWPAQCLRCVRLPLPQIALVRGASSLRERRTLYAPASRYAGNSERVVKHCPNSEDAPRAHVTTRHEYGDGCRLRPKFGGRSTRQRHDTPHPLRRLHRQHFQCCRRILMLAPGISSKILRGGFNHLSVCITSGRSCVGGPQSFV